MADETILYLYLLAVIGLGCAIWFRHPFPLLIAFVAFCLSVGEFYPFSNFPMYSDPDDRENYFVLASVPSEQQRAELPDISLQPTSPAGTPYYIFDGIICKPLPVYPYTAITAPTMKKMFKSRMDAYAKKHDTRRKHLTPEQREIIGQDFLKYLREQAVKSEAPQRENLPEDLVLLEFWIEPDTENGGFTETPGLVARLPGKTSALQ